MSKSDANWSTVSATLLSLNYLKNLIFTVQYWEGEQRRPDQSVGVGGRWGMGEGGMEGGREAHGYGWVLGNGGRDVLVSEATLDSPTKTF